MLHSPNSLLDRASFSSGHRWRFSGGLWRLALVCLAVCCCLGNRLTAEEAGHPNILFIAVDDLRPQLACYGEQQMHTPNIDRLASQGVLFERAYCMVPTCGASRASLLSGIRPNRKRFVNYLAWAEKDAPTAVPLNTYMHKSGYQTYSLGKVYHHREDHAEGWSEPAWRSKKPSYQLTEATQQAIAESKRKWPSRSKHRGPAFEAAEVADAETADGDCALQAVKKLEQFAKQVTPQPFFLAVGFLKPHLPFNAPQKYWDLYDPAEIELPSDYAGPYNMPEIARHNSGELRAYSNIPPKGLVPEATAKQMIHGYYACVSFTDAQVGLLLDTLDQTGLADNTIVVLWGDHGWQLGEHGMWNKHSCFETSMHAPLIISAPQQSDIPGGTRFAGLTEFIDIYPTLCELAGLPLPSHLEGESLVKYMQNPQLPGKPYAIGRFGSGDTIRSDSLRYSEYTSAAGQRQGQTLFDHQHDPAELNDVFTSQAFKAAKLRQQLQVHAELSKEEPK